MHFKRYHHYYYFSSLSLIRQETTSAFILLIREKNRWVHSTSIPHELWNVFEQRRCIMYYLSSLQCPILYSAMRVVLMRTFNILDSNNEVTKFVTITTRNLIIQMHLKVCKNYDGYVFHRRVACRRDVIQSVWNIFAKQYNDFKNE